jgi:hypothetical protein
MRLVFLLEQESCAILDFGLEILDLQRQVRILESRQDGRFGEISGRSAG